MAGRWALAAARLVVWVAAVVLGVVVLLPILVHALPGDAADIVAGRGADDATVSRLRHELGLDAPLVVQVARSVADVLQGDLGRSVLTGESVGSLLGERIVASAWIVLPAWGAAVVVGSWTSAWSALGPGGGGRLVAVLCGIPEAVVAVALVVVLAVWLGLLPAVSLVEPGRHVLSTPGALVLPVLALAVPAGAWILRMSSGIARDVAARDYVQDALDRGHSRARVARRHMLPAISPAIAQLAALSAGALLAGSVVVEQVVAYPGLGELLASSVAGRDLPVIRAASVVMSAVGALLLGTADLWAREVRRRIRAS